MLQCYKPEHFPMKTTHVAGLPLTTFQVIFENISTRIQLYHISEQKKYNHRAVSPLAVESMFSNLTMYTISSYFRNSISSQNT